MQYETLRAQTRTKTTAGAIKGHVDNTSQPGGTKKKVFLFKPDGTGTAHTINTHVSKHMSHKL